MIIQRQSGLGRGLGALIPPKPVITPPPVLLSTEDAEAAHVLTSGQVLEIPIQNITPNPRQPRHHFDHTQLEDLIASIKEHGILQPIIVTEKGGGHFELIAGERRLRAATIAGLETVPAIVREAGDTDKLELAIIENVQRQDLNPLEEARGYLQLMEEFSLTQDDVSKKVGKSRSQVANTIRLLQLSDEIQRALVEGKISASNARTLLSLSTDAERNALFTQMLAGNFTVRQTEERVPHPRRARLVDPNVAATEARFREWLHLPVRITRKTTGTGDITIHFSSDEEFAEAIKKLTGTS